jgi:glycosyltransferase involved in cell wall biosynthesis
MSIMESLFFGCPVISFDIKYGPASLISNGVNGFLISPNNAEALANQIVLVLKDRALLASLIEGSLKSVEKLTHEAVARKWASLLESLEDGEVSSVEALPLNGSSNNSIENLAK